jgi:hypothetical protein
LRGGNSVVAWGWVFVVDIVVLLVPALAATGDCRLRTGLA